jgi:hypothetical protein
VLIVAENRIVAAAFFSRPCPPTTCTSRRWSEPILDEYEEARLIEQRLGIADRALEGEA